MFQNKTNNDLVIQKRKQEEAIIDDMVFSDKDSQEEQEQVFDLVDAQRKKEEFDASALKHNEIQ